MPDFDTTGMQAIGVGLWVDPKTRELHACLATILESRGLEYTPSNVAMVQQEIADKFHSISPTAPLVETVGYADPGPIRLVRAACLNGHHILISAYDRNAECPSDAVIRFQEVLKRSGFRQCSCGEPLVKWTDEPTEFRNCDEANEYLRDHCAGENLRARRARDLARRN